MVRGLPQALALALVLVLGPAQAVVSDPPVDQTTHPLSIAEDPQSQPLPLSTLRTLFANKSVALLLVGDAFRKGGGGKNDTPCHVRSYESQREASLSYVTNVIRPLVALGATVEVVYTFPRCDSFSDTRTMRSAMHDWFAPYVTRSWTTRTDDMDDGWRKGYRVLRSRVEVRNESFDYVLQGRHDVLVERPITTWPADFSKVLFEMECRKTCGGGCHCGTLQKRFLECDSGLCTKDHLMWTPRKHHAAVDELMQRSFGTRAYAHHFVQFLLTAGRVDATEVSYLFPSECSREGNYGNAFQTDLMCNQNSAYRPTRKGDGQPVSLPREEPDEL
jgi:hypothetical protein